MTTFTGFSPFTLENIRGIADLKFLDRNASEFCRRLRYYNPACIQCARLLESGVFKEEIQVIRGKQRMKIHGEFEHVFKSYWIPFAKRALTELLCTGVVPVKFVWIDDVGYIPVVVEERGDIGVYLDKKTQAFAYLFFPRTDNAAIPLIAGKVGKPDTSVLILSSSSICPDPDGKIRSPLSSLIKDELFISSIDNYLLVSEDAKAAPWILTQVPDRAVDGYGDSHEGHANLPKYNSIEREAEERLYSKKLRMAQEVNLSQYNSQLQKKTQAPVTQTIYTGNINFSAVSKPPRVWTLEVGHTAPQTIMPTSRTDWLAMHDYIDRRVFEAHGIPFSFNTGGGHIKAGVVTSELVYYQTLSFWRDKISRLFNEIFPIIYGEQIIQETLGEESNSSDSTKKQEQSTTAAGATTVDSTKFDPSSKDVILRSDIKKRFLSKMVFFEFPNKDLKAIEKRLQGDETTQENTSQKKRKSSKQQSDSSSSSESEDESTEKKSKKKKSKNKSSEKRQESSE